MEEVKQELFKEFFICPHCKKALYSKENLEKIRIPEELGEVKYCQYCGRYIAYEYKEALQETKTVDSDKLAERVLKHYGLSDELTKDTGGYFWIMENSESTIERYRFDLHGLNQHKKFRTIIYCDSEYDKFVVVTSPTKY